MVYTVSPTQGVSGMRVRYSHPPTKAMTTRWHHTACTPDYVNAATGGLHRINHVEAFDGLVDQADDDTEYRRDNSGGSYHSGKPVSN